MQRKQGCDSACSLFQNTETEVAEQSKSVDYKTSYSILGTSPSSSASPSFTWQNKNINSDICVTPGASPHSSTQRIPLTFLSS